MKMLKLIFSALWIMYMFTTIVSALNQDTEENCMQILTNFFTRECALDEKNEEIIYRLKALLWLEEESAKFIEEKGLMKPSDGYDTLVKAVKQEMPVSLNFSEPLHYDTIALYAFLDSNIISEEEKEAYITSKSLSQNITTDNSILKKSQEDFLPVHNCVYYWNLLNKQIEKIEKKLRIATPLLLPLRELEWSELKKYHGTSFEGYFEDCSDNLKSFYKMVFHDKAKEQNIHRLIETLFLLEERSIEFMRKYCESSKIKGKQYIRDICIQERAVAPCYVGTPCTIRYDLIPIYVFHRSGIIGEEEKNLLIENVTNMKRLAEVIAQNHPSIFHDKLKRTIDKEISIRDRCFPQYALLNEIIFQTVGKILQKSKRVSRVGNIEETNEL